MNNELEKRLKEIKGENIIFGIFIILIILAYYANDREVDYFLNKNQTSKQEYYYLMIFIFLIVVIVSGYYFYQAYQEIELLKYRGYSKEKEYAYLDLIASGATLIAGLIYLYIAITDTDITAEISL
ncbi:MAG: hypothetical protein IJ509_02770 [Bacilli bacterium]|nr:hypothetical protein [Bacilli bacterium]